MKLFKAAVLGVVIASAIAPAAFAKGGKEFYSQDYQFSQPMKGYEGTGRQLLLFVPASAEPRVHHRLERQRALQGPGLDAASALLLSFDRGPRRGFRSVAPLKRLRSAGSGNAGARFLFGTPLCVCSGALRDIDGCPRPRAADRYPPPSAPFSPAACRRPRCRPRAPAARFPAARRCRPPSGSGARTD